MRPLASWAIDSEPIRTRGIIVKKLNFSVSRCLENKKATRRKGLVSKEIIVPRRWDLGTQKFTTWRGDLGWRCGESTHLPPLWPEFDFLTRPHMWYISSYVIYFYWFFILFWEFFFNSGNPVFQSLLPKTDIWFGWLRFSLIQCNLLNLWSH